MESAHIGEINIQIENAKAMIILARVILSLIKVV